MDDERQVDSEPPATKEGAGLDIHFRCPCGAVLSAPEDKANTRVACGQCSRILVVPRVPVAAGISADDEIELPTAQEVPASEELEMEEKVKPPMSGMAVASLVLGLVGPFLGLLALVAGVLALIFGGVALRSIKQSPFVRGKGTAIAGIVLGVIDILLGVTFLLAIYGTHSTEDSLNVVLHLATLARPAIPQLGPPSP